MLAVAERVGTNKPQTVLAGQLPEDLPLRQMSLEEYEQLVKIGFFDEDERLELLEGMLVEMSPINPRHADCVDQLNELLAGVAQHGGRCRIQSPIRLAVSASTPQPDLSVVVRAKRYAKQHPGAEDTKLIIEVADSTLATDRSKKGELFARAGIAEYWVVNLVENQLEVDRNPQVSAKGKGVYKTRFIYLPGQTVAPLAYPMCEIAVAEIFPDAEDDA